MPLHDKAHEEGALFALERDQRLSASMLWRHQRAFFHRRGIDAWRSGAVPHYVTGNPAIAQAYTDVVLGFQRDAFGGATPGEAEPLHVVELGAGSGRFGYLFLKAFSECAPRPSPLRYIMTDFTPTNLDFCAEHPALQRFVEQGILDFGVFDAERDTEIALRRAGAPLSPGAIRGPLVVIANYFFDSISQDAFIVKDGQLHESLVSVWSPTAELDPESLDPFSALTLTSIHRPVDDDYYPEVELNDALRERACAQKEATFLFPCTSLRCVRRLGMLARGPLLVISGDRNDHEPGVACPGGDLGMAIHGSFSLPIDHEAMSAHCRITRGRALRPRHRHAHLDIVALLPGEHSTDFPETRAAYERAVRRAGPDDFFTLRLGVQAWYEKLDFEQLLSMVRMSHHDPRVLGDCARVLSSHAERATAREREAILQVVMRVWENYYPIGEPRDLAFELAALLYRFGAHTEALWLFQRSASLHGDDPRTRWNMGLCHLGMRQADEAARCFAEALARDPGFDPRGALQSKGP